MNLSLQQQDVRGHKVLKEQAELAFRMTGTRQEGVWLATRRTPCYWKEKPPVLVSIFWVELIRAKVI